MFFLLLIGDLHTVRGSLEWTIVHMTKNPEPRDKVIADPTMIAKAVEEILHIEASTILGNRHLSFGAEMHCYVGPHVAHVELAVALDELHRRIPDCRLIEAHPPIWRARRVRARTSITETVAALSFSRENSNRRDFSEMKRLGRRSTLPDRR
jgi:cytochrome P450